MLNQKLFRTLAMTAVLAASSTHAASGLQRVADTGAHQIAIGVERTAMVGAAAINQLHGMMEVNPGMWLGLGLGMDSNFDAALIGADFRYNAAVYQSSALFVNLQAGYVRMAAGAVTNNGFAAGLALGFDIPVVGDKLRASAAYGLQFGANLGTDRNFGITNNGFEGNFGLHWYF